MAVRTQPSDKKRMTKTVGTRGAQDEKEGRTVRRGKSGGENAPGGRFETPARGLVRVLPEVLYRDHSRGKKAHPWRLC